MRRCRLAVFATIVVLTGVPGLRALASEHGRRAGEYTRRVEETVDVDPGGTLRLEAEDGQISVEAWEGHAIRLIVEMSADVLTESEADAVFGDHEVEVRKRGNDVEARVKSRRGRRPRSLSVEYLLRVPEKYSVDLHTGSGGIRIDSLEGDVLAHTGGGSVELSDVAGDATATSSGGEIRVGRVGGNLKARTKGGSIEIEECVGTVEAKTSGGSVKLRQAGKAAHVRSLGGSLYIGPCEGDVTASTGGGPSMSVGQRAQSRRKRAEEASRSAGP